MDLDVQIGPNLGQRMVFVDLFPDLSARDAGVNLRGLNAGVAEKHLNGAQVSAALEKCGAASVTKCMRAERTVKSGGSWPGREPTREGGATGAIALIVDQNGVCFVLHQFGTPLSQIIFEFSLQLLSEWHEGFFSTLTDYAQPAFGNI